MKKLIPAVLILGGAVAGLLAWRSATEANRRCSELLELVRENGGRSGSGWSERDAERFWDDVEWFRAGNAPDLGRRLVEALRDGPERDEAARLTAGLIEYMNYRSTSRQVVEGRVLPPPTSAVELPFRPDPFRLPEAFLADAQAVERLAEHASPSIRLLLSHFLWCGSDSPSHAWAAAARLAERDPDLDVRTEALRAVARAPGAPDAGALLARLTADPEPNLRLAALAALAENGDAQRGRDLIFAMMLDTPENVQRRAVVPLIYASDSLSAHSSVGLELKAFVLAGVVGLNEAGWELAERYGNVLERRAVGEYDEPVDE